MRAKWLWVSWAYLMLGAVIVIEIWFVAFAMLKIVPVYQWVQLHGWGDADSELARWWMSSATGPLGVAVGFARHCVQWGLWWMVLAAIAVGLFEWRVQSENKSLMRLAAIATVALGWMVVMALTASGLAVAYAITVPSVITKPPERIVIEQESRIERSLGELEQALTKMDWAAIERLISNAAEAAADLERLGASAPTISALKQVQPLQLNELRAQIKSARESLWEARAASVAKDENRLKKSLEQFRSSYAPLEISAAKAKPEL